MARKKQKIAQFKSKISKLVTSRTEVFNLLKAPNLSVDDFTVLSKTYNSLNTEIHIIERKIQNLKDGHHELGVGDELEFERIISSND